MMEAYLKFHLKSRISFSSLDIFSQDARLYSNNLGRISLPPG